MRAALHAAWAASKAGAVSLAILFTIVNLAYGIFQVAEGHAKIVELPGVVVGGAAILVLSLLFSPVVTVPVSSVIAACAYPFLRPLRAVDHRAIGIAGCLVGVLVWLGMSWNGPAENLYFGSPWISPFVVGGPAGYAGGLAFARNLRAEH